MHDLLFIPLLALHLLCVNVAAAGPLVALWLEWRESRGNPAIRELAGQTATYLGRASLLALLLGGVLGGLLFGLRWSEEYSELWLKTMRYKAMWGLSEYAFSLLLAVAYLAWRHAASSRWRGLRMFLLLLSGTNLLYHFPFLFSIASAIDHAGGEVHSLSSTEFRHWMMRPDVLARVVHVVLASFAVTGILLMGRAWRLSRALNSLIDDSASENETPSQNVEHLARWSAWLTLIPTLLQLPVGVWLVLSLPPDWQSRALGDDLAAAMMFGTSILLALFLLQDLASLALGEVQRKLQLRCMALMGAIVLLMTGVLERVKM